ncbi:hypothetical protein NHX12_024686, partial [Muraenolepis orangiensis]
ARYYPAYRPAVTPPIGPLLPRLSARCYPAYRPADKAQQELLMVRQRLEDKLRQEIHALCAEEADMSKEGLVRRAEVVQHMRTSQSLELADPINSLDEE